MTCYTVLEGPAPLQLVGTLHDAGVAGLVWLDSAACRGPGPYWSLVAHSPSKALAHRHGDFVQWPGMEAIADPVQWLLQEERAWQERWQSLIAQGGEGQLPPELPFVGGLAGFLGFEFGWLLEDLRTPARQVLDDLLWVGSFEGAYLYEHATGRWHVIAHDPAQHARMLVDLALPAADLADFALLAVGLSIPRAQYEATVEHCRTAISLGDLFEINYTERFAARWSGAPLALYAALRQRAPGPFGCYIEAPGVRIASISPEQFLLVAHAQLTTRPIKGTRARGHSPHSDAALAKELLASAKDRAENVMIVDLMRNDLTRVALAGTVQAKAICALESYASVHHLVSTVQATLHPDVTPLEALLACFPAGSITGAPKIRSMEYIATLEHSARGAYTGSAFYASAHGRLDSSVLIRTAELHPDGHARYGAGGAVVSDSIAARECDEAFVKAAPFFHVATDRNNS